jgi:hypothetical protein
MLIDTWSKPEDLAELGLRWWMGQRYAIGWKGHVYLPSLAGGERSVAAFSAALEIRGVRAAAAELSGVFGLFIYDRRSGTWQVMVDNAGLYKVFHAGATVSTSFLELIGARPSAHGSVRPECLLEYIAQGAVYGPDTFLSGIRKLRGDEILEINPERPSAPLLTSKHLVLPPPSEELVLANFAELACSLAERRVSADITGGFDTRVILCLLRHCGLDPELAVSGPPTAEDVIIPGRIAALLRRPLLVTGHDLSWLDQELRLCFAAGDGQSDAVLFHRDWQHARARLDRGIEVMVHGGGGAHFKDFFCFQDFPRYGSPRTNFGRYYDLRISPVSTPPRYFTRDGAELARELRVRTLARFEPYRAPTNNESYDRIAYFLRAPEFYGRYSTTYINMGLDFVAPFLEYKNALIGMRLSPWARFFNGWHRRTLTAHCPQLAALPTTEGYTGSTALRHMAPDLVSYTRMQLRRVAKKTSQRLLGRSLFDKLGSATVNHPELLPRVRTLEIFAESLERLKVIGILAPDLTAADVRSIHVGRMLTAGLFLRELDLVPASSRLPMVQRSAPPLRVYRDPKSIARGSPADRRVRSHPQA